MVAASCQADLIISVLHLRWPGGGLVGETRLDYQEAVITSRVCDRSSACMYAPLPIRSMIWLGQLQPSSCSPDSCKLRYHTVPLRCGISTNGDGRAPNQRPKPRATTFVSVETFGEQYFSEAFGVQRQPFVSLSVLTAGIGCGWLVVGVQG